MNAFFIDLLDIIGEVIPNNDYKAVISSQIGYFLSRDTSSILDGEYRVFGKIVKYVKKESQDHINLLRKTTFSRMQKVFLEKLKESQSSFAKAGFSLPDITPSVGAPAIQIIPLAIYV